MKMYASVGWADPTGMEIAAHASHPTQGPRIHVSIGDLYILLTPEQAAQLRDALTAALTPTGDTP